MSPVAAGAPGEQEERTEGSAVRASEPSSCPSLKRLSGNRGLASALLPCWVLSSLYLLFSPGKQVWTLVHRDSGPTVWVTSFDLFTHVNIWKMPCMWRTEASGLYKRVKILWRQCIYIANDILWHVLGENSVRGSGFEYPFGTSGIGLGRGEIDNELQRPPLKKREKIGAADPIESRHWLCASTCSLDSVKYSKSLQRVKCIFFQVW